MRNLLRANRLIAAGAVAGAMAVATTGIVAHAASNASSPSPSPTASPAAHARAKHRGLISRIDHATIEIRKDGKWVTENLDRGNVTAASSSSITLARPDGQSVTFDLSSSTKFRGKEATSASGLKTGVRALVVSENGAATLVVEGTKPLK
jgi:hypothetical protein